MVSALLALVIGVGVSVAGSEGVRAQSANLVVRAGDGEIGFSVNQFMPTTITVEEGSSITWTFPWPEPHIVAFLAGPPPDEPAVSPPGVEWPNDTGYVFSGEIFGNPETPPTFTVAFPTAGSYQYFCPIHPQMVGTVNVVEAGDPGVDNQLSADANGNATYVTSITTAKEDAARLAAEYPKTSVVGGKTTKTNIAGWWTAFGDQVNLFFGASVTIREGDTMTWNGSPVAPHNVVFNPQALPEGYDPFGTTGVGPANGVWDGTGAISSPILSEDAADFGPNARTSYSLTFSKAGTYQYLCLLHADQGMVGQVVVEKRTAPLPPNTGSGIAAAGEGGLEGWYVIAGAIALATGVAGASVVAARRR
jgi:plastocyanin